VPISTSATPGATTAPNPAGLTLEIAPGPIVATGAQVWFKVSAKKPGYLVLVDIDASGTLRQIYAHAALAEELEIVSQEVKAGKDKSTVLRGFGERAGVPDISSFVTVMIQSQQFGTSIAEALRVYAAEMRDKRVMRAEEAANKLPVKMTLGTMMFTVPPLLIILVGPSVYDMIQMFANFKM
jgi:hypothetical protein